MTQLYSLQACQSARQPQAELAAPKRQAHVAVHCRRVDQETARQTACCWLDLDPETSWVEIATFLEQHHADLYDQCGLGSPAGCCLLGLL